MKYLDLIIKYGTILFVFLIPWQARLILVEGNINGGYWEYGTQSLYATEVLFFVLLVALLAKGALAIKHNKPSFSFKRLKSPIGILAILIIWSGLSIIWSVNSSVALEHWIVLLEAGVIFLVLISRVVSFNGLAWTIIASGFIQATIAITQSLLQVVPGSTIFGMAQQTADMLGTSVVETDSSRWLRAYGTFPHPNILGGWLVVSLLSLIAVSRGLVQEVKGAKDKITKMRFAIRYLFFAVIVFGLLATFSRSAWLAALIGIGIFIIISIKEKLFRRLAIKLTGILIIVVVLFGALFPDQLSSRINNQDRLEVKSTQERVAGFGEAWEVIKQNRILGTGIGNYGLAVHQDIDNSQPSYYYQPAHNVLMLVWAELGIVVLFSILYFLSSIFMRKKRMRILRAGILFLPIIIISLFDHYLWSLYSGMMILMVYFSIFFLKLGKK